MSTFPVKDIVSVKPLEGFRLNLTFEDEEQRIFDFKSFAKGKSGLVREIVEDEKLFSRVTLDGTGTICWPNGYDIAQEYLYAHSVQVRY